MATRARVPGGNNSGDHLTAAALPLYPYSPLKSDYNRTLDYIINARDGADMVAWGYFKTIPELHYLVSLVANALSMVRLYVGEVDSSDPDNPKPVGPRHPANDLLRNFAGGDQGQSELMMRLATHLVVAGDSIAIGPNPAFPTSDLPYPFDEWRVYGTGEVQSRNNIIYVKGPNYRTEPIPEGTMAVRIWKQNPIEWWKSDSPVKAAFGVLREIELLNAHIHATAISRQKGSGILCIPEELTLPGDEIEVEGEDADPFVRVLTEIMSIAIKNPDSAAALVPIIIRGPGEFLKDLHLVDFHTKFDDMVPQLRDNALRRLALGMDSPPEILLGSEASASWSMWQISEAQLRLHLKPLAHLICSSLTVGWLRPALDYIEMPAATRANSNNLVIWPDFSQLHIRPDVGKDAESLFADHLISEDAFRHILGLGDNEAPSKKELAYQILLELLKSPQYTPYAVKALSDNYGIPLPAIEEIATKTGIVEGGQGDATTPKATPMAPPAPAEGAPPAPPEAKPTIGTAPKIPGDRSVAKQTAPDKAPPADGDKNNNQANSLGKK